MPRCDQVLTSVRLLPQQVLDVRRVVHPRPQRQLGRRHDLRVQAAEVRGDGEGIGGAAGEMLALRRATRARTPTSCPATLETVLRLRVALVVVVFVACAVIALLLRPVTEKEDVPTIPTPPGAERGEAVEDPFAWTESRSDDARAAGERGHGAPALHALARAAWPSPRSA